MSGETQRRIVLAKYAEGPLQPSNFAIEACEAPQLEEGQFRVRNHFVSVDPMLRIWVDAKPLGGSFAPPPLGSLIAGAAVGEVVESRHPDYAVGDRVEGRFGWQEQAVSNGAAVQRVPDGVAREEQALGIYGLPGFTAYVGLHQLGDIAGKTILVSGAAGAVGSVVGPLVQARGGRAVGIASGKAKQDYLVKEAGYDAVADRTAPDFDEQLKRALPDGANVYFDNVGGPMLVRVLPHLARGARVLISGLMAQYQSEGEAGVDNLPPVLHAVMGNGVTIGNFSQVGQDALRPDFVREIGALVAAGKLNPKMHIEEGLERVPDALCGLFENSRTGKVVVHIGG
ncbi:MAG TPA: NADP-dependent oxidoreductase [Novosphingobium sp.]|nr:NADP-dependent oxidoreductase [Novosphingobium sp.]